MVGCEDRFLHPLNIVPIPQPPEAVAPKASNPCEGNECIPEDELPVEFRAMMDPMAGFPEMEQVDLPAPEPDEELLQMKEVPEEFFLSFKFRGGGRSYYSYVVTIDREGNAKTVDAGSHVPIYGVPRMTKGGKVEHQLTTEEIMSLIHKAGEIGFFEIDEKRLKETCETWMTGQPRTETTLRVNHREKTISNNRRCNPGTKSEHELKLIEFETLAAQLAKADTLEYIRDRSHEDGGSNDRRR